MVVLICDNCKIKYPLMRNVKGSHKNYCGIKCRDEGVEVDALINGRFVPFEETREPDLFDWVFNNDRLR